MKNKKLSIVLAIALLMGVGSAYAGDAGKNQPKEKRKADTTKVKKIKVKAVPEIDATSGVPAIALVLGVALLGAERLRRHSAKHAS